MQRFLVVGNGQPAAALISELIKADHAVLAGFLTSEANGRAALLARSRSAPIHPEAMIRDAAQLAGCGLGGCDWLLCANTTCIVPRDVLAWFPARALNFHPGPLPEYAGLHTHQWAIRRGETGFGVTIHLIEPGLDVGDIVAIRRFPITPDDTGLSLYRRAVKIGAELFAAVLRSILAGRPLERQPQDLSKRRLYRKADAMDGRIDWCLPAQRIVDFVRAADYHPFSSPSYVPTIDDFGMPSVVVLKAGVAAVGGPAGRLLMTGPDGPVIGAGGGAVVLKKAMRGGRLLDFADWTRLFERHRQPVVLGHG